VLRAAFCCVRRYLASLGRIDVAVDRTGWRPRRRNWGPVGVRSSSSSVTERTGADLAVIHGVGNGPGNGRPG